MRKFLSAVAILVTAAGLIWLVRLERPSSKIRTETDAPAADAANSPAPPPAEKRESTLGSIGGELPKVLVDPELVIHKSRRTLAVVSAGEVVKTYRIALGSKPKGDKVREGDRRTPEGSLYVAWRNGESKFVRFLGLSYPDAEAAERGLDDGLIGRRDARAIKDAARHYRKPPQGTALGGDIGIHGGGTGHDWTAGCIALSDADILELYPRIALGTPIEVRP